jgi:Protein of unknown function (DUF4242)
MELLRSPQADRSALAFLVERYLPASAAGDLATSIAHVARICAEQGGIGTAVRYLHSMYLPAEDTCFCVFQAPSSDAVRAVNDAGHFPLDRITDAVLMITTGFRSGDATSPGPPSDGTAHPDLRPEPARADDT